MAGGYTTSTHIKCIEAQPNNAHTENKCHTVHGFCFYFSSQFLQSQRSCSIYSIQPASYILKMHLYPFFLISESKITCSQSSFTLESCCCCCCCFPNLISGITNGLSPLKPTYVSHLRPLTAQPAFVSMKTSLPYLTSRGAGPSWQCFTSWW